MKTIEEKKQIIIENISFMNCEDIRVIKDILNKYERNFTIQEPEFFKYYEKKYVGKAKGGLRKSLISMFDLKNMPEKYHNWVDNPLHDDISFFLESLPKWILYTTIELNKNLDDKSMIKIIRIQKEFIKEEMLKLFLKNNKKYIKYIKTN